MDSYSALVSRVLKQKILREAALEKPRSGDACPHLNLVTLDWEAVLDQSLKQNNKFRFTRKYTSVSGYHYESTKNPLFNVTLVAQCRFLRPFDGSPNPLPSVFVSDSDPLNKLARFLTKDLQLQGPISEEFKFTFPECSTLICRACLQGENAFKKKGYQLNMNRQPCIGVTKVFDGAGVYNRFHSQMVDMFSRMFIAILNVNIDSRYSYTDPNNTNLQLYRISGKVTSLLAFNECKLETENAIQLGDLPDIGVLTETAAAESDTSLEVQPASATNGDEKIRDFLASLPEKEMVAMDNMAADVEEIEDSLFDIDTQNVKVSDTTDGDFFELEGDFPSKKKPRVQESFFAID